MNRLILLAGLALHSLAQAAPKPKPPVISVCGGPVCLFDIRWMKPDAFLGRSLHGISGTLINTSTEPIAYINLQFGLFAGNDLLGTASAGISTPLAPGGRWSFDAEFVELIGSRFVTLSNAVQMDWLGLEQGQPTRFSQILRFDPVFNPANWREQKEWEKIHGPHQR